MWPFKDKECKVCEAHLGRVADLKLEIARLVSEKENERAEYKRAIDALLHKEGQLIIGQGVPQAAPAQMDLAGMLGYMDSETQGDRK